MGVKKAKEHRITKDGVISECLMWPEAPKTQEEIYYLKNVIYSNDVFYGPYVSYDSKSALIFADLYEWGVDYKYVYDKINEICDAERDTNHEVYLCGSPLVYGHVHNNIRNVIFIFIVTIIILLALVYYYFKVVISMIIPCLSGIISSIWGMGFVNLLGYDFDPLILVIPFLITARSVSHSVQMVERYHEEYELQGHDIKKACTVALAGMFPPGLLGILTDCAGILIIALIPIPLMKKLAFICGFWGFSIVFSALILHPILLSYFAKPESAAKSPRMEQLLTKTTMWCIGKGRWINLVAITVVVSVLVALTIQRLYIGDPNPGSSLLWPDSKYNQDVAHINKRFPGTYPLMIAVEGDKTHAIKNPEVLHVMEKFQRFIERDPSVGGSLSAVDVLTRINMNLHEGDPRWGILPKDVPSVGSLMYIYIGTGDPGDFDKFGDNEYRNASIIVYYKDKRGETIKDAIEKARNFFAPYQGKIENFKFSLAGGVIGTLAAINEVVGFYSELVRILIFMIIFVFCSITYRSPVAGIILVIPVAMSDFLSIAYMAVKNIGLNINTLPVASVGVGVGLDYGIYITSRIREEYAKHNDLNQAIIKGLTTSGKAVTFTATTLIGGVIFWYILSDLRFQGEMGFLLAFLMFFNMLGAIFLLPTLIAIIKPKFICRV
jgi:predicted RND superfamily exporter protein